MTRYLPWNKGMRDQRDMRDLVGPEGLDVIY